jgi:hypothetical protein
MEAKLVSFMARFTSEAMAVDAEPTPVPKALPTQRHRHDAVHFIDSIATDPGP